MSKKTIIAVNIKIPDDRIEHADFGDSRSPSDADIVLFDPSFVVTRYDCGDTFGANSTYKGLSAAKRAQCALVRTTDLFFAARHVDENPDEEFAKACRASILSGAGGIVTFPSAPPALGEPSSNAAAMPDEPTARSQD